MRIRRINASSSVRVYIAMGLMCLAFAILLANLWDLQVDQKSEFEDRQKVQSLRRVRLPGIRGKIYDRNGLCLADNRPTYAIALYPEDIRRAGPWARTIDRAMEVAEEVGDMIGEEVKVDRDKVWSHIKRRLPLPLVLWNDITPSMMGRLAEKGGDLRSVDFYTQATRSYPYGEYTSHLIGYVGRADMEKDPNIRYNYYLPEMGGRAGLEKLFDNFLRGEAGGSIVQIDVSGYHHGDLARRPPKRGGDLRLTLDMEVQLLAHKALGDRRGAVVVIEPASGDVLAMLSGPSYDANEFVPVLTTKVWNRLNTDPDKPLLNRAVAGSYAPGSTFKPLVGLAASSVDPDAPYTVYDSPGYFKIGRRTVHTHGFGRVDMREALRHSANVYFFKTAMKQGYQCIIDHSAAIGLGKKTGVEVDYERSGLLPDAAWQAKAKHGGWTDGDTCNLSIGQGFLETTPLQLALLTATIANGGTILKPHLLQAYREPGADEFVPVPARSVGQMNWSQDAINVVHDGMLDVIMASDGTGKKARVEGFPYAAKTGTAEYGRKSEGKKHTWMIAFAPFENPQYAVAFLIEDGASGGSTVGPRLKILMEGLYTKLQREGRLS